MSSAATSIVINKIDIVVINTGYTSRLLNRTVDDLNDDWEKEYESDDEESLPTPDNDESDDEESEEYKKRIEESQRKETLTYFKERGALFVHDSLWGTGLYKIDDDVDDVFINSVMENVEGRTGIIAFKCDTLYGGMSIADQLSKIQYCAFFCLETLCEIKQVKIQEKTVLYLEFDAESG